MRVFFRIMCGACLGFLPYTVFSQGLINNGAQIVIQSGSVIYIDGTTGNFTDQSGGQIKNSTSGGIITLKGNWVNNASNTVFSNSGATVDFASSSAQSISGTNSTAFYNLTAEGAGTKTANTASTISNYLNVLSSTEFNSNGKITLLATSSTNANVKPLSNGASVTGNVIVQSFYTGGGVASNRSYRSISSPINDNSLSSSRSLEQLKGYMIVTGPGGATKGFDPGGALAPYSETLRWYNEPALTSQSSQQFLSPADIYEKLTPGKGIFFYFRGNRDNYTPATASTSKKVNSPYLSPEDVTMQYVGPINQGDISVPLLYTANSGTDDNLYNGFNLVGNPYPAVIDWTLVTRVNTEDQISIYKPGGGYATYFNGVSTNGTNVNIIQPGQGFWVRANASGASVTFKETAKSVASAPARFLSAPASKFAAGIKGEPQASVSGGRAWNQLRLNLQDGVSKEETVVIFNAGSSAAAGFEDATFWGGSTVSLSSRSSDSKDLVVNFMPEISQVAEVRLNVNATASGNVTLNVTDLSAVGNYTTLLQDNYLNTMTDVSATPTYSFTINKTVAASFGSDRFKLLFQPPTTLPVTLTSFTIKKVLAGAELNWKTASEQNSSHFELERSGDGKSFSSIGKLKAAGNSSAAINYSYVDKNPLRGISYYRLKQFDFNGKMTLFDPVSINYELAESESLFNIYPNPIVESFNLQSTDEALVKDGLIINIYDLAGKKLSSKTFSKGQELKYNIVQLPKGIYVLEALNPTTHKTVGKAKVIKE